MKQRVLLVLLSVCALFLLLAPAFAEDFPEPDLAADARQSGDNPPTIPHSVKDDADGQSCNQCHTAGFKVPHPDRLNCTQCHVPGALPKKPAAKGAQKVRAK
jgi:cytochrome c-type protein NapB